MLDLEIRLLLAFSLPVCSGSFSFGASRDQGLNVGLQLPGFQSGLSIGGNGGGRGSGGAPPLNPPSVGLGGGLGFNAGLGGNVNIGLDGGEGLALGAGSGGNLNAGQGIYNAYGSTPPPQDAASAYNGLALETPVSAQNSMSLNYEPYQAPNPHPYPEQQLRPIMEESSKVQQVIPPMQVESEVVAKTPYDQDPGVMRGEQRLITRSRPPGYHPLVPRAPLKPLPIPATPPAVQQASPVLEPVILVPRVLQVQRPPPPIQRIMRPISKSPTQALPPVVQLPSCDFDPLSKVMLKMINCFRSRSSLRPGRVCANAKLMRAAKLQSDFQALVKVPTHSGPRLGGFGSLEERLRWAKFGGCKCKTPLVAEQLIFHWPHSPPALQSGGDPTVSTKMMTSLLKQAMASWRRDSQAVSILLNPRYRFFGFGLTRTRGGQMFLTTILGDARDEACHVCPGDLPKSCLHPAHGASGEDYDEEGDEFWSEML